MSPEWGAFLTGIAVGWFIFSPLRTAWRRHRWSRMVHTELERNGLEVEKIHWNGDIPGHIHIKHKEGHHDADG